MAKAADVAADSMLAATPESLAALSGGWESACDTAEAALALHGYLRAGSELRLTPRGPDETLVIALRVALARTPNEAEAYLSLLDALEMGDFDDDDDDDYYDDEDDDEEEGVWEAEVGRFLASAITHLVDTFPTTIEEDEAALRTSEAKVQEAGVSLLIELRISRKKWLLDLRDSLRSGRTRMSTRSPPPPCGEGSISYPLLQVGQLEQTTGRAWDWETRSYVV